MQNKILWLILMLIPLGQLCAQQEDIRKLQQFSDAMRKQRAYFEVTYRVTDRDRKDAKPVEESTVICYSWYPYTVFKYPDVELYHNDKTKIMVDKRTKHIVVNKADKKVDRLMVTAPLPIDSLLRFFKRLELIQTDGRHVVYRIHYKTNTDRFEYSDLAVDLATNRIERMSIYYKSSMGEMGGNTVDPQIRKLRPRVDILYAQYKQLTKKDWNIFTAGHILKISASGKVVLQPSYALFKVSNYYRAQ